MNDRVKSLSLPGNFGVGLEEARVCDKAICYHIPTLSVALPARKGNVETLISSPVYECIFIL